MMKEKDDELELITRVQARRTVFFPAGNSLERILARPMLLSDRLSIGRARPH